MVGCPQPSEGVAGPARRRHHSRRATRGLLAGDRSQDQLSVNGRNAFYWVCAAPASQPQRQPSLGCGCSSAAQQQPRRPRQEALFARGVADKKHKVGPETTRDLMLKRRCVTTGRRFYSSRLDHCQQCAAIDRANPPTGIDVTRLCARATDKCAKHGEGGKLAAKPHKGTSKCQCSACCKDCGRPNGIVLSVQHITMHYAASARSRGDQAASVVAAVHNQALAADMGAGVGVFAAGTGRGRARGRGGRARGRGRA